MQKLTLALLLATNLLSLSACHQTEIDEPYDSSALYVVGPIQDLNSPDRIPVADLPQPKLGLVRNYHDLVSRGLLNHTLSVAPERRPWPSTFFPTWFGGVAGRWQDHKIKLIYRSLFGMTALSPAEAETLLQTAQKNDARSLDALYRLAPTEKYDLGVGDYTFRTTRIEALQRGHNLKNIITSPFWMGYCNGTAIAATRYSEPFREVDVVNPDGFRIRFHPNDIKALLALTHSHADPTNWHIGGRCNSYTTSSPECMDVNPATLILTLANRVGLGRYSVIIDKDPLAPVINVPVRSATITVLRPPYAIPPISGISSVMDVKIDIEVASTTLSTAATDVRDTGAGKFKKVAGGSQLLSYEANIALDPKLNLIGGRWLGRQMSGPDFVWDAMNNPAEHFAPGDRVQLNRHMRYSVLEALYQKSISTETHLPALDITSVIANDDNNLFATYYADNTGEAHRGRSLRILGRLGSKYIHRAQYVTCVAGPAPQEKSDDLKVVTYAFSEVNRHRTFLDFDLYEDLDRPGENYLKCSFYAKADEGGEHRLITTVTPIINAL